MSSEPYFFEQIRNLSCGRPLGSRKHKVELSLNGKKKKNSYLLEDMEEEAKRQRVGNEGPDVNAKKFDAKNK